jgi:hypothetical protein
MDDNEWIARVLNDPARETKMDVPPEGLTAFPLVGYRAATISANNVLMTIEVLVPPPNEGTRLLRLGITRAQCAELSEVLERLAMLPHNSNSAPN